MGGVLLAALTSGHTKSIVPHISKPPPTQASIPTPVHKQELVQNPILIRIPKLSVEAEIEAVGLDSEGRMDVPKNVYNVGWYSPGVKPGEIGSAVMDGHVDTPQGEPSVFAQLNTLMPEDIIEITSSDGKIYKFKVVKNKEYLLSEIPMNEIFRNVEDESRLNLITCSGAWDKNRQTYLSRYVIFATRII